MTDYEKLKQIIQASNPEIMEARECECFSREEVIGRPIRLADVLLALKKKEADHNRKLEEQYKNITGGDPIEPLKYPLFYTAMMAVTKYELDGNGFWNFADDNLDHQSDETKQFLTELLVQ